ncbi:MAG: hypothetical protein LBP59_11895 [Planctomycetaceae bacterium]|nr:hypothetical protein [Planctomycetaceae bacterium]
MRLSQPLVIEFYLNRFIGCRCRLATDTVAFRLNFLLQKIVPLVPHIPSVLKNCQYVIY